MKLGGLSREVLAAVSGEGLKSCPKRRSVNSRELRGRVFWCENRGQRRCPKSRRAQPGRLAGMCCVGLGWFEDVQNHFRYLVPRLWSSLKKAR